MTYDWKKRDERLAKEYAEFDPEKYPKPGDIIFRQGKHFNDEQQGKLFLVTQKATIHPGTGSYYVKQAAFHNGHEILLFTHTASPEYVWLFKDGEKV